MRLLACIVLLASTVHANALEATLGREGREKVLVWRDGDAHSEGVSLISAGVHKSNPRLVMRLLSCMVDAGTKAVVIDMGFMSSTVLITEGRESGCRGDIPNEDLKLKKD